MSNVDVWNKVLSEGEKIEYEFSVGDQFIKFNLIFWLIVSLLLWPLALFVIFYYGFYLKKANIYAFTNKRVLIHRGWLSTSLVSIDYNKITDIAVTENFFAKLLTKTGNLIINTASTDTAKVILLNIAVPYEVKKKLDRIRSL